MSLFSIRCCLLFITQGLSFQSQEVTYAEFTMPRNKGYAPMKARSTDSPVPVPNVQAQYSTGVRNPPPMPPPRYTAPPTAEATPPTADDDPFASEMPLVSNSVRDWDGNEVFMEPRAIMPRPKRGPRLKHMEKISGASHWSSLPDNMNDPGRLKSYGSRKNMSLEDKRKIMMKKNSTSSFYETSNPPNSPQGSQSGCVPPRGEPIPRELLDKRRVLLQTLQRVQHQSRPLTKSDSLPNSERPGGFPRPPLTSTSSTESEHSQLLRSSSFADRRDRLVKWNTAQDSLDSVSTTKRQLPKAPILKRGSSLVVTLSSPMPSCGTYQRSQSCVKTELATIHSGSFDSNDVIM